MAYHKKSPKQLRDLAESIGTERIQVMHGTADNLITLPHVDILYTGLGGDDSGVTKTIFEGRGHYLPLEERHKFKILIESLVAKTQVL